MNSGQLCIVSMCTAPTEEFMSDGKVQSPLDLTETQPQTVPSTETKPNQKRNLHKTRYSDLPFNGSRRSFMGKAGGLTAMNSVLQAFGLQVSDAECLNSNSCEATIPGQPKPPSGTELGRFCPNRGP